MIASILPLAGGEHNGCIRGHIASKKFPGVANGTTFYFKAIELHLPLLDKQASHQLQAPLTHCVASRSHKHGRKLKRLHDLLGKQRAASLKRDPTSR